EADVFAPLAAAGVGRSELQLAWDFTTGSEEWVTQDMLRVRELTLAWLGDHRPALAITSVSEPRGTEHLWRVIEGTVSGPLFLESTETSARLVRDANGRVIQRGTTTFPF